MNCNTVWCKNLNQNKVLHSAGELLHSMTTSLPIDVKHWNTVVKHCKVCHYTHQPCVITAITTQQVNNGWRCWTVFPPLYTCCFKWLTTCWTRCQCQNQRFRISSFVFHGKAHQQRRQQVYNGFNGRTIVQTIVKCQFEVQLDLMFQTRCGICNVDVSEASNNSPKIGWATDATSYLTRLRCETVPLSLKGFG